jgi:hypothetical protein
MELDQSRFKASAANAALEKPFDTQKLRQIVQKLVPKTGSQTLSPYLKFPKLPDFEEGPAKPVAGSYPPPPPPEMHPVELGSGAPAKHESNSWSMENFAPLTPPTDELDADEFMPVQLPSEPVAPISKPQNLRSLQNDDDLGDDNEWFQKTLSKYKMDPTLQEEVAAETKPEIKLRQPQDSPPELTKTSPFAAQAKTARVEPAKAQPVRPQARVATEQAPLESEDDDAVLELDLSDEKSPDPSVAAIPQLNEKQLEAIIRAQSKEVIEKVVWQVVPEIATRIIERELERLLKERQSL